MLNFKHTSIYHIDVYTFNTNDSRPFQLTFSPTLDDQGVAVHLQNIFGVDDMKLDCDIRETVCRCFMHYLSMNPSVEVTYNLEICYKRNLAKLRKFLSWARLHPQYSCKVEIVDFNNELYAEVKIKHKPLK